MKKNLLESLKEKKKIMKLSMTALVGAMVVYGSAALYSSSAMKNGNNSAQAEAEDKKMLDLSATATVGDEMKPDSSSDANVEDEVKPDSSATTTVGDEMKPDSSETAPSEDKDIAFDDEVVNVVRGVKSTGDVFYKIECRNGRVFYIKGDEEDEMTPDSSSDVTAGDEMTLASSATATYEDKDIAFDDEVVNIFRGVKSNGDIFYKIECKNGRVFYMEGDVIVGVEENIPSFDALTDDDFVVNYAPTEINVWKAQIREMFKCVLDGIKAIKVENTPEKMEEIRKKFANIMFGAGSDEISNSCIYAAAKSNFAKMRYLLTSNAFEQGKEDYLFFARSKNLVEVLLYYTYQSIWCPRSAIPNSDVKSGFRIVPLGCGLDRCNIKMLCHNLTIFARNHSDIVTEEEVAEALNNLREFLEKSKWNKDVKVYLQTYCIPFIKCELVESIENEIASMARLCPDEPSCELYMQIDALNLNLRLAFESLKEAYNTLKGGGILADVQPLIERSQRYFSTYIKDKRRVSKSLALCSLKEEFSCTEEEIMTNGFTSEGMINVFSIVYGPLEEKLQAILNLVKVRAAASAPFLEDARNLQNDFKKLVTELFHLRRSTACVVQKSKKSKKSKKTNNAEQKPKVTESRDVLLFDSDIEEIIKKDFKGSPKAVHLRQLESIEGRLNLLKQKFEKGVIDSSIPKDVVEDFSQQLENGLNNIEALKFKINGQLEELKALEEQRNKKRQERIEARKAEEAIAFELFEQVRLKERMRKLEEQKKEDEKKRENAIKAKILKEKEMQEKLEQQALRRQMTKDAKQQEKAQSRKEVLASEVPAKKEIEKYEVVYFNDQVKSDSQKFLSSHSADKTFVDAWQNWFDHVEKEGSTGNASLNKLEKSKRFLKGAGVERISLYPGDMIHEQSLLNPGKGNGMVVVYYVEKDTNKVVILYVGEHFGDCHGNEKSLELAMPEFVSEARNGFIVDQANESCSQSPALDSQSASAGAVGSDCSSGKGSDGEKSITKKTDKKK